MNVAGFDFGSDTTVHKGLRLILNNKTNCLQGTVNLASADPPLKALGGNDGAGQMSHFAQQDGLNLFRLRKTSSLPI